MKAKMFFSIMTICAMCLGLVSCEPTTLGKKNVLINLAELGEQIDGKSVEEIEEFLSKKGFTQVYDWTYEGYDYFNTMRFYTKGIQLDTAWFYDEAYDKIGSKARMQEENACILLVDHFIEEDRVWVELGACYILPEDPIRDYKTLSNNLYRYCSANYPFKINKDTPKAIVQGYEWHGDVLDLNKEWYDCTNDDEYWGFALQAGLITQEEYDKKLGTPYKDGWRNEFLQKISEAYIEVVEEIKAANTDENRFCYTYLLMSDGDNSFIDVEGMMLAECYWVGVEPELPYWDGFDSPARMKSSRPKFEKMKNVFHGQEKL